MQRAGCLADVDVGRGQCRNSLLLGEEGLNYYFRPPPSRLTLKRDHELDRASGEISVDGWHCSRVKLYEDFPPEIIRVVLLNEYRRRLIKNACKLAGSMSKLAELTKVSLASVSRYRDGTRSIPYVFLQRLDWVFKAQTYWDEVKNHVKGFKLGTKGSSSLIKIEMGKRIFDFNNVDGARIVAAFLGDGHLGERVASYMNPEIVLRRKVHGSIQRIIGDVPVKTYRNKEARYPQALVMILKKIGLYPGAKVFTDPSIPSWVKEATDVDIPRVFLRQFFSDEAYVNEEKHTISLPQSIDITDLPSEVKDRLINAKLQKEDTRFAPRRLLDVIEVLRERFNIKASEPHPVAYYKATRESLRGERLKWRLIISGKTDLEKFDQEIGFDLNYKQKALRDCICNIRISQAKSGFGLVEALQAAAKIESTGNEITSSSLAEEMGHRKRTSQKWLRKMDKNELVEKIGGGKSKGYPTGRSSFRYRLTDKARRRFMC